jgi:acetyl-CoA synthetase
MPAAEAARSLARRFGCSVRAQVSEAQIAVHWREEEYYPPPPSFVAQANANDPAIFGRFAEFPGCFKEYADLLDWDAPWRTTLDTSNPPFWKWFVGRRLNASYNCVDRHAAANPDKTAIIFVPELESDAHMEISYSQLHRQVNEFAALLRDSLGLQAGDRVTLHMPMVPELPVTMLACARPGVIHSQVFRRVQRCCLRAPDRRLGQPVPDHDGRLLSRRPADRSQDQGR